MVVVVFLGGVVVGDDVLVDTGVDGVVVGEVVVQAASPTSIAATNFFIG